MRPTRLVCGFVLVAVIGFGLSSGSTRAQPAAGNDANHHKVTVTGTATVAVKPDTARVSFAVKAGGADFKTASAECDKKAAVVEKAIKDLKIGGLEVKKGPLNFMPMGGGGGFGGPGGGPMGGVGGAPGPGGPGWVGNGFDVSRTFTVIATFGKEGGAGKLDDIVEVADKLLVTAVTAGATENPTFSTPSYSPYGGGFGPGRFGGGNNRIEFYRASVTGLRQEALKSAVADALANAKVAAGAANLTAKDIVTITDQSQYGGPFGYASQASNTGRGEVLGEMELTVSVSVTFSY